MPSYNVYVSQGISQVVRVDAASVEEAIEQGIGEAEGPNSGNRFDLDGEPRALYVHDEDGQEVWCAEETKS